MVMVCVPALPPCPATIGMNAANTAAWAIVLSKSETTAEARKAVPRLITSQGSRLRIERGIAL